MKANKPYLTWDFPWSKYIFSENFLYHQPWRQILEAISLWILFSIAWGYLENDQAWSLIPNLPSILIPLRPINQTLSFPSIL